MQIDTPGVDVDAPIPYRLTPLGHLTLAAWRCELRFEDERARRECILQAADWYLSEYLTRVEPE